MGRRILSAAAAAIGLLSAPCDLASAAPLPEDTKLRVAPGPTVISEDEAALTSPEHAIVLVDETSMDDSAFGQREVRRHVRAKVLTNEGRELADVEIPMWEKGDRLVEFWGRTLLPDGRVLDVPLERVTYQRVAKGRGRWRLRYARAALPGVIPGSVVDYGYVLRQGLPFLERIDLQQQWPVRRLRIRWRPYDGGFATAWRIWNGEALDPRVSQDKRNIRVDVDDIPAFVREPWMPPDPQARPSVALFYLDDTAEPNAFWGFRAAKEAERIEGFSKGDADTAALQEVLGSWDLPEDLPLDAKLEHAYRWIGNHVRNLDLASSAEVRADGAAVEGTARAARHVLAEHEGTTWEIAALFAGFARKLGAQPVPVLAADRTWQVWDVQVPAPFHFDEVLVGVRFHGKMTLCAPGSGLRYGDLPWWASGAPALFPGGVVQVPVTPATRNLREVIATATWSEAGTVVMDWATRLTGQHALDARRELGQLHGEALQNALHARCGGHHRVDAEFEAGELQGIDRLDEDVRLRCTSRRDRSHPRAEDAEADAYAVAIAGPWIEALPDFEGRTERVHAVVFSYPSLEMTTIEFDGAPGFVPAPDPIPPVTIDSPYGRYKLTVSATERGFRVERGYALTALSVPAEEYGALRRFLDGVRRADRARVTFVRRVE